MKIKLSNNFIIQNVDYASINTIDGKLTIGINGVSAFESVYSKLSNEEMLTSIKYLTDNDELVETFVNYVKLSLFSVNKDANNMIFWIRRKD